MRTTPEQRRGRRRTRPAAPRLARRALLLGLVLASACCSSGEPELEPSLRDGPPPELEQAEESAASESAAAESAGTEEPGGVDADANDAPAAPQAAAADDAFVPIEELIADEDRFDQIWTEQPQGDAIAAEPPGEAESALPPLGVAIEARAQRGDEPEESSIQPPATPGAGERPIWEPTTVSGRLARLVERESPQTGEALLVAEVVDESGGLVHVDLGPAGALRDLALRRGTFVHARGRLGFDGMQPVLHASEIAPVYVIERPSITRAPAPWERPPRANGEPPAPAGTPAAATEAGEPAAEDSRPAGGGR